MALVCAGLFATACAPVAALAADSAWNVDADGLWTTDSNWTAAAPGSISGTTSTDVATFSTTLTGFGKAITVDANRNIAGISFGNTSSFGFTLTGGKLLLTSAGVIQSLAADDAHMDTVASAIAIQGNGGSASFTALSGNGSNLLNIAGVVSGVSTAGTTTTLNLNGTNIGGNVITGTVANGAGGGKLALAKSDASTWQLNGSNTYTGTTTLNLGTLIANNAAALGNGGDITFGGGTLQYTLASAGADYGTRIKNSTRDILLNLQGNNVAMGAIDATNTGGIVMGGTYGTLFLSGANAYTGVTTVGGSNNNGGGAFNNILILNAAGALGGGGNITFSGGSLRHTTTNTVDYSARIVNSSSAINIDTNGQNVTFGSALVVSNSGGFGKWGAGDLTFSGNTTNTYTGQTTVNQGRLILNNTGANNNTRIADSSSLTINNGATFLYKGADVAGMNSTESITNINSNNFGGNGIITVSFGGTNLATLTATGSFGHSNNQGGTFLVNGVNLGKNSTDAASVGKIIINTAPTLVGTTNAVSTGINVLAQDTRIVSFLVGEATATTGGSGTATGVANTFVTYVAGAGLRPLNPTDEFVNNTVTANKNTYVTAATASSVTAAINSLVINGGDLSIAAKTVLTITSGATLFASSHAISSRGVLAFGATEAQITVNPGVTGTIAACMTGTGGLTKSGAGTLNLTNSMVVTGGFEAEGGGTVNLTQADQFSGNFVVGGFSSGNSVNVSENGTLWSTAANTLDIGCANGTSGTGAFGNNTVDVSTTGSGSSASLRFYSLMLGGESSNNQLIIRNGANLRLVASGNGTWDIGHAGGSNNNVLTLTGAGSELSRGPAQGSAIQIGNGGSNNSLVVSAGAHLHLKRIILGNSAGSNNNHFTVTGLGSWFDNAFGQLVFAVGNAANSSANVVTIADQAVATIDNTNGQNSRNWSIGASNGANNNAVVVDGIGTQLRISHNQPWALGGVIAGNGITDTNGQGNHLDITGGASLIPTQTPSGASIYLMGVQSALNLGNGTNISTALIGGTTGFVSGVYMPSADARLNINSGRLIAYQAGLLVSGWGQIQLNGPAYFSTTQTGASSSILSSVIAGSGNLIKEGSGNLILQAANTYTGTTVVNAGTISLDHAAAGTRLASTSTLVLGGGTVDLYNGATTEVVAFTSLTAGRGTVARTAGSSTLRMNTITPGLGIVNFDSNSIASTTTTNTNGILGAWAMVGGIDWAMNSGVNDGGSAGNNFITAFTAYTHYDAMGSVLADGSTNNARLDTTNGSGNITLGAPTTTINTLLQSNAVGAATVDTVGGVLATNGIMISTGAGAVTIGVAAGDGSLRTATASANLVLNNNNSGPVVLTINAPIVDNTVSGLATAGTVVLNGVNTFTGGTGVGGTLTIGNAGQLNSGNYAGAISLASNGTLAMNTTAAQTLSGVISGDGAITQLGSGTTTLSGANTYTGPASITTFTGGILVAANATAFGNPNTASLVFGAGTNGKAQLNSSVTVIGLNTNTSVGTPVIEAGTAGLKTLTINAIPGMAATTTTQFGNNSNNYSGVLQDGAGSLAVVKNGTGTLRLGGTNTYGGGTTVNGGVITLGNQAGFGLGDVMLASTTMIQQDTFEGNAVGGAIANNFILGSGDVQSNGEVLFNMPAATQKDMWITGNISGAGRMRVISDVSGRTLTLSGAKSFSGGIVQSSGAIQVGGTQTNQYPNIQIDNVGSLGTGTFRALINGTDLTKGTLTSIADLSVGSGVMNNFDIGNAARLVVEASATNHLKLSGAITGGGSLVKTGSARLTLAGNNTYKGSTTISTGTLLATHPAAFGGTSGVTVASAAGLVYAATVDAPLVINGTLSITGGTGSTTTTIGTAIGSTATSTTIFTNGTATATAGSITVDIAGILGVVPVNGNYTLLGGPTGSTLSALANYSLGKVYNPSNFTIGSLVASATTLSVAVTAQAPLGSIYYTGGLANGNGEWAASNGSTASNWAADAAGAATSLTPGASSNVQFTNPGAALPNAMTLGRDMTINSIAVKGSSTVNLSLLPAGENTLTIGSPGSLNSGITVDAGAGSVTLSPTTIKLGTQQSWSNNSTQVLTIGAAVDTAGFSLTAGGSGTTMLSGVVSGSGGLTSGGSGVLSLSGVNSYSGLTTIGAGVLQVASTLALPGGIGATGGTSALTFNGGVIGLSEGNFYRPVAAAGIASGVHFTGAGGWAASGGNRTVNLGGAGSSIAWGAADTGLNGQTLILGAATATHTVDFQNPINLGNALRTVRVDNGSAAVDGTLSGVLSGSAGGTLTKTGLGTLKITNANTFTGGTAIEAGTLVLASESALGAGGPLTLNAGTLDLNGKSITTGALGGAGGTITTGVSGATILTVNSASNSTFAGEIADGVIGTVGLTKSGSGSLTLAGVNVYSGSTVVEAGRLAIDGSINTDVSIASGAFLGGSGTIGDATNVGRLSGAGTISPGSITSGILTAYTFDPLAGLGAAFVFTAAGVPDFLNPSNSLNDVLRLTSPIDDPFQNGFFTSNNQIDIYFNIDSIQPNETFQGGFLVNSFAGNIWSEQSLVDAIQSATFGYWLKSSGSGTASYNGVSYTPLSSNDVALTAVVDFNTGGYITQFTIGTLSVPEPNSIVLAGIGIGMAAWSLWKRRRI